MHVVDKGWERLPETELYLVSVDASLTPAIRVDGNICDVVQMCFKSSLMLLVLTEAVINSVKKKMLVMVFPTKLSEFVKLRAVTFDRKRGYQIAQY